MTETEHLIERCRNGNTKLWEGWHLIQCQTDTTLRHKLYQQWDGAFQKLLNLCYLLQHTGYRDCLYLKNGKPECSCSREEGCFVCPSKIEYWKLGQGVLVNGPTGKMF